MTPHYISEAYRNRGPVTAMNIAKASQDKALIDHAMVLRYEETGFIKPVTVQVKGCESSTVETADAATLRRVKLLADARRNARARPSKKAPAFNVDCKLTQQERRKRLAAVAMTMVLA